MKMRFSKKVMHIKFLKCTIKQQNGRFFYYLFKNQISSYNEALKINPKNE